MPFKPRNNNRNYATPPLPEENKNVIPETTEENEATSGETAAVEAKKDNKSKSSVKKIPKVVRVIKPLVRIRKGPSLNDPEITTVSKGAEFKMIEEISTDDFVGIAINGTEEGYIMRSLVEIFDNPAYVAADSITKL